MSIVLFIVFGVLFYFINLASTSEYELIGNIGGFIWFFAICVGYLKWGHKLPKFNIDEE